MSYPQFKKEDRHGKPMTAARFVFYWEDLGGEQEPPTAFYNVPEGRGETTVSARTLKDMEVDVPETPSYAFWKKETEEKRRCGKCWRTVRGARDLTHHFETNHKIYIKGAAIGHD